MLLTKVELKNVCQHKHAKLDLKPGLIGVSGQNGSGKSNFVQLIKASLTNDFGFKGTNKEQKVRRGAAPDELSFVSTDWSIGSTDFHVRRNLVPSSSLLQVGKHQYDKVARISKELQKLLGISSYMIDNYVFVDQWSVFAFLSDKPAVRMSNFAQLCGAAHIEKLWKILGDQISKDRPLAHYDSSTERYVRRQIDEVKDSLRQQKSRLADARAAVLSQQELSDVESIINDYGRRTSLRREFDKLKEELARLNDAKVSAGGVLAQSESDLSELKRELLALQPERESHVFSLRAMEDTRTKLENLANLRKQVDKLSQSESPPRLPRSLTRRPASEVEFEIAGKRRQLLEAENTVKLLKSGLSKKCPTCKSPLKNPEQVLDEAQDIVTSVPGEILQLEAELSSISAHEKAEAAFLHRESIRRVRLESTEELLLAAEKAAEGLTLPDVEKTKVFLRDFDALSLKVEHCEEKVAKARDDVTRAESLAAACLAKLSEVRGELKKLPAYSQDEYNDSVQLLTAHRSSASLVNELAASVDTLRSQLDHHRQELKKLAARKAATSKAGRWISKLESLREVVHRDKLPKIYMQAALEELVADVNTNLSDFGSPFSVGVSSKDLSFIIINRDGTTEPAEAKSGGEMVILAIAYRLAVNARFASDVSFMVLDEPSAGLDSYRMGCLADVLRRLDEVTRKRRQQVILITHDQRLERVFDQLIEF